MTETSPAHSAHHLGTDRPVYEKYLANLRSGIRMHALGSYRPLTKNPSDIPNAIALRPFFTEGSNQELTHRIIKPIEELSAENGIPIYSGALWTPHTTISNFLYLPGVTPGTQEEAFNRVLTDSRIKQVAQNLEGLTVDFDFLFGGNAIVIAVSLIPTHILEARRQMTQIAEDLSMGEDDYSNILHTTVARIAKNGHLPPSRNPNAFGRGLMRLHHTLFKQPLSVRISKAEVMPGVQMVEVHEAPLARALLNAGNES